MTSQYAENKRLLASLSKDFDTPESLLLFKQNLLDAIAYSTSSVSLTICAVMAATATSAGKTFENVIAEGIAAAEAKGRDMSDLRRRFDA